MWVQMQVKMVDLRVGVYGSFLQIASIFSVMEGYQWRVMKGEVVLEM